jgi:hypothetical protein
MNSASAAKFGSSKSARVATTSVNEKKRDEWKEREREKRE